MPAPTPRGAGVLVGSEQPPASCLGLCFAHLHHPLRGPRPPPPTRDLGGHVTHPPPRGTLGAWRCPGPPPSPPGGVTPLPTPGDAAPGCPSGRGGGGGVSRTAPRAPRAVEGIPPGQRRSSLIGQRGLTTCDRALRIGWQGSRSGWRHGCSTGLPRARLCLPGREGRHGHGRGRPQPSLPLPARVPTEWQPPIFRENIVYLYVDIHRYIK